MELMVGLTIGLLVVVAALGSLAFTQATSGTVGDSARLQQTADNTFRILGFPVQKAGAINFNVSAADPSKVMFSDLFQGFNPAITGATANQIFVVHGLNGASNGPDTLRVSYQDDGTNERDCLGNRPDAAQVGIRVDNQFTLNPAKLELTCLGAQTTVGAQPIAGGVEDFQVTYGVLTLNAGAPQYRFYSADQILDWSNIQAINICIQLVGERQGNPQPGLVVRGCRDQTIANDGFLRKVFQRTYSLRNALL